MIHRHVTGATSRAKAQEYELKQWMKNVRFKHHADEIEEHTTKVIHFTTSCMLPIHIFDLFIALSIMAPLHGAVSHPDSLACLVHAQVGLDIDKLTLALRARRDAYDILHAFYSMHHNQLAK